MAEGNINLPGVEVKEATFVPNNYVNSGSFKYIRIGKMICFIASYTFIADIGSSILNIFTNIPEPVETVKFPDYVQEFTDLSNIVGYFAILSDVTGNAVRMAHTAGKTYVVSGCYIAK